MKDVDLVKCDINIYKVMNTKNGGVVLDCADVESISNFKQTAANKLSQKYEIHDPSPTYPVSVWLASQVMYQRKI